MTDKRQLALDIVRTLRAAGHTALFAGGCVRDMLRAVPPHDYDVVTSARPEQVRALFRKTFEVGAQFGVVLVVLEGVSFEVATFRSDDAYEDGRRPVSVTFSTPEADAQRRDFTMNGLFYDPVEERVLDYVAGRADIERRVVRCIGDATARFTEDKLRMLRAVRFASNLGYNIEPETFRAIQRMAPQIAVVSAERIRDELIKIFTRPNAGRGLRLLDSSGLLGVVLPEVTAMKGCEQPPQFHPEGDVFVHTCLMMDGLREASLTLAFATLLHDVGKPPAFQRAPDRIRFNEHDVIGGRMTETILRRLRFPNDSIGQIVACVENHMVFRNAPAMRKAKLKRLLARPTFAEELELHRLDCLASHADLTNYDFLKNVVLEIPPQVAAPPPLITGDDLLAMGMKPGPEMGALLREARELQLEEKLHTPDEALAWARQRLAH
ncbi:MAG: CCA tRNA nucleotidyltransferase [Verrucomicrobia bacterium]|nr:CCA tRNA nucleotidyltransferase [Verrucomicrobiota bacterium]